MSLPRTSRRRVGALSILAASALLAASVGGPASAAPATGSILGAGGATTVADSYLVVLKDSAVGGKAGTVQSRVDDHAATLARSYGGEVRFVYGAALNGFAVTMSERAAKRLAANPAVEYVEQDSTVSLAADQLNPPWGLDRIDQRNLPLNQRYSYTSTGRGVTAYIIDTGIRTTHREFSNARAGHCYDAIDGQLPADDGNGHGTHVAGTVAGVTVGVAKEARVCAVRVLGNTGSGTWAGVIAGIDWVTRNHVKPAVANMSLGGGYNSSVNTAVANSVKAGVTYAIAAGNSNANACNYSPASTPSAITVGATQSNDYRASYSNYGTCLDIFAPGSSIYSSWHTSDSAYSTISGTSMAAPHVAGAAARVLQRFPNYTPAQVASYLSSTCTANKVINPGSGSRNCLLYVDPTL